jgi:hypothetical protein
MVPDPGAECHTEPALTRRVAVLRGDLSPTRWGRGGRQGGWLIRVAARCPWGVGTSPPLSHRVGERDGVRGFLP